MKVIRIINGINSRYDRDFDMSLEKLEKTSMIMITYNVKTDLHCFSFAQNNHTTPINIFRDSSWHNLHRHDIDLKLNLKNAIIDLTTEVLDEISKRGIQKWEY